MDLRRKRPKKVDSERNAEIEWRNWRELQRPVLVLAKGEVAIEQQKE